MPSLIASTMFVVVILTQVVNSLALRQLSVPNLNIDATWLSSSFPSRLAFCAGAFTVKFTGEVEFSEILPSVASGSVAKIASSFETYLEKCVLQEFEESLALDIVLCIISLGTGCAESIGATLIALPDDVIDCLEADIKALVNIPDGDISTFLTDTISSLAVTFALTSNSHMVCINIPCTCDCSCHFEGLKSTCGCTGCCQACTDTCLGYSTTKTVSFNDLKSLV
jgi:hypothetical protein